MADISILMTAKNAGRFIAEAIRSVRDQCELDYEMVVVDDGSVDDTVAVAREAAKGEPAIRVLPNAGVGKVSGLNTAYQHSKGTILTTLDADDTIDPSYWRQLSDRAPTWDAMARDYRVVDCTLRPLAVYHMSSQFFRMTFEQVVASLKTLPRATWTVQRWLAEHIFPIPHELPFEDVWWSLVIRRFADRIEHVRKAMYNYRQHEAQTFGGVLSYRPEVMRFRASRLTSYASLLPRYEDRLQARLAGKIATAMRFYSVLASRDIRVCTLLRSGLTPLEMGKVLFFRRFWRIAAVMKRIQWLVSGR